MGRGDQKRAAIKVELMKEIQVGSWLIRHRVTVLPNTLLNNHTMFSTMFQVSLLSGFL
jgi:hypothetical protein